MSPDEGADTLHRWISFLGSLSIKQRPAVIRIDRDAARKLWKQGRKIGQLGDFPINGTMMICNVTFTWGKGAPHDPD